MDQQLIALFGAGGVGAVLVALINGAFQWLSGAASREREKNAEIIAQRKTAIEDARAAEKRADEEAAYADKELRLRRQAEEHVSVLKRQILELGETPRERVTTTTEEQHG